MKTALAAGVAAPAVNLAFAPSLFAATSGDPIILGHQCDLTGGISKVENGEIHVKHQIASADVERHFPPRYDFTTESF